MIFHKETDIFNSDARLFLIHLKEEQRSIMLTALFSKWRLICKQEDSTIQMSGFLPKSMLQGS